MADRQFVDFDLFPLLTQGDDQFLIRCSRKITFAADPQRPAREGMDRRQKSETSALCATDRSVVAERGFDSGQQSAG